MPALSILQRNAQILTNRDIEAAEDLVDACRPVFGSDPVFVSEIGPVVGAHAGPGLLGFGSINPELLPGD